MFSLRPNSIAKLVNLTGFGLGFASDEDRNPGLGGMKLEWNVRIGEARSSVSDFVTNFVPLAAGVNGASEASNLGGSGFASFVDTGTFVGVSRGDCVRVWSCLFDTRETNMESGGDGSP